MGVLFWVNNFEALIANIHCNNIFYAADLVPLEQYRIVTPIVLNPEH